MMDWIIDVVYSNTLWLYKVILINKFFFIDFWTFNHIWSGAFIFVLLTSMKVKKRWLILILLLFTYEIIEILFRIFALNLFKPEIIKDQINDIIFGVIGAVLCYYLMKFRKGKSYNKFHLRYPLTSFLTAGTISYLYVGFSGFGTNSFIQNHTGFILLIFVLLWIFLFYLIQFYEYLKSRNYKEINLIVGLSFLSFPLLLLIQITSWAFLTKMTGELTLFFDEFYNYFYKENIVRLYFHLLIPFLTITLYNFFRNLVNRAMR